jgi:hypothetical protein
MAINHSLQLSDTGIHVHIRCEKQNDTARSNKKCGNAKKIEVIEGEKFVMR